MRGGQVLLTGDYWHSDFQEIVKDFDVPVTLVPAAQIESLDLDSGTIGLVVVAESRRGQLSEEFLESLFEKFPGVPLVGLLGSWCEGETRSGEPFAGLIRVYWHQWRGRYQQFRNQLIEFQVADWHAPRTTSLADQALKASGRVFPRSSLVVGVSANRSEAFEMLRDGLDTLGYASVWLERVSGNDASRQTIDVILMDGSSFSVEVERRIEEYSAPMGKIPIVLALSFPRRHEVDALGRLGVGEIVSKPFQLSDLGLALERAMNTKPLAR